MESQKGFTLLELSVTIFIIILLSSALVASNRNSDQKMAVSRAAKTFTQTLRQTQEMSMAAEALVCNGGNTTRIFGVNIKQTAGVWDKSYILFGDCNTPYDYSFDNGAGVDKTVQTITIEKGVRVCNTIPPSPNHFDAVFEPPHPLIHLNTLISNAEMEIIFCSDIDATIQKKVKINTAGRIEIE